MLTYPYRMAPFAEIHGAAIIAVYNHYRRDEVLESVRSHHLTELDPDGWYSVDDFINLFAEWFNMDSSMSNLVSVGMALIYHMEFPPDLEAADYLTKLLALGELHMMHHRNGDVGGYKVRMEDNTHIVYTENTVWPDDMIYGYIYGAAERYLPKDTRFILSYDETIVRQEQGGDQTVLHLTWS